MICPATELFTTQEPGEAARQESFAGARQVSGKITGESWLSDMDSNHDKGLQRALCYHYTIGQADEQCKFPRRAAQRKFPPSPALPAHGVLI
jgi:hypothetical protein